MKNYKLSAVKKQAGMTLIELTVVLLVLIGLAGLMIPYVAGFVQKTHDSTGTNNLARLNSNFGRFENEFMRYPDNMEALINGVAGTLTSGPCSGGAEAVDLVYCNMMHSAFFTPLTLNGTHVMSLNAAGINTVLYNDPDTDNATFSSVTGGPVTLAATGVLAEVNSVAAPVALTQAEHLAEAFGGQGTDYDADDGTFDGTDNCYDYVGFGVGDGSEMIGRTMNSAPIHFASSGDMAAANRYNRFIAVFKVDSNNTAPCSTSTDRAKFIGSAMSMAAMSGHLWGAGHSAGHAYENLAAN